MKIKKKKGVCPSWWLSSPIYNISLNSPLHPQCRWKVVHGAHANVVKAVVFYGIMPRIVVKVLNWTPWSSWISMIPSGLAVFDSKCFLTSAATLFLRVVWIKCPFCCISSLNGRPCCLPAQSSVCPRWCWMRASRGGRHVLLRRSCSYGNTTGSAGLCIEPVCQLDSKD